MMDIKYKWENHYTDLKQQSRETLFKKGTYFMNHNMNKISIDKKQLLHPITNISPSGFELFFSFDNKQVKPAFVRTRNKF